MKHSRTNRRVSVLHVKVQKDHESVFLAFKKQLPNPRLNLSLILGDVARLFAEYRRLCEPQPVGKRRKSGARIKS